MPPAESPDTSPAEKLQEFLQAEKIAELELIIKSEQVYAVEQYISSQQDDGPEIPKDFTFQCSRCGTSHTIPMSELDKKDRPLGNNPHSIDVECICGLKTRIPTTSAMFEPIPEGETCTCQCHGSGFAFKETDLATCQHCAYRYAH